MKSSEQLRKPENWQDFEKLCLMLWGEIWNIPEDIEFNASNSEGQDGVDIYGFVESYDGYVGIQCKNLKEEKRNGQPNNILISNIRKEIEKAEGFQPVLKRYIIATSAEVDGGIQKEVRLISEERRSQGKFPVEIKFWNYISMKVDQHKSIHDWYLKSQNFKNNQSIKFTFDNDLEEITISPIFSQAVTMFSLPNNDFDKLIVSEGLTERLRAVSSWEAKYNKSFVPIVITVKNTGELPIQNWKFKILVEGECNIDYDNRVEGTGGFELISQHYQQPNILINREYGQIKSRKDKDYLVKDDVYSFDEVYVKPNIGSEESVIKLKWELLSKDFQDKGTLTINVKPIIKKKRKISIVNSKEEVHKVLGDIVDYIST